MWRFRQRSLFMDTTKNHFQSGIYWEALLSSSRAEKSRSNTQIEVKDTLRNSAIVGYYQKITPYQYRSKINLRKRNFQLRGFCYRGFSSHGVTLSCSRILSLRVIRMPWKRLSRASSRRGSITVDKIIECVLLSTVALTKAWLTRAHSHRRIRCKYALESTPIARFHY